jgi:hypothetical protein
LTTEEVVETFCLKYKHAEEMYKVSFLSKIKNIKSFADFKEKVKEKVIVKVFASHEQLVSLIYGKHKNNVFDFNISHSDADQLLKVLNLSKQQKASPNQQIKGKRGNSKPDQKVYEGMNITTTYFEIKKTDYYDSLLKKLYPVFKDYLKCPFSIVNLNARMTKPNAKTVYDSDFNARGPDRMHRDGYPSGHFKCMIYPKPLTKAYGQIKIDGKLFENKKPGSAVLFNPDLFHHSTSGKSEMRYAIEITLMRTLVEVDILKHYPSTPDSKYFYHPFKAYF